MFGLSQLQERLVWIAAVIAVFVGYTLYERHVGAKACLQNVEAANTKEAKKEDIQYGKDVTTTQKEGETFENAKTEPIAPAPVITLGVCSTLHHKAGPSAPAPGPGANAVAGGGAAPAELSTVQWDTEPIVRIGHEADAQIAGLQDYIVKVCRPE